MTITFNSRTASRAGAIVGVTVGMGVAAFFGGQATRMSDTARAAQQSDAVERTTRADQARLVLRLAAQRKDDAAALAKAVDHQRRHDRNVLKRALTAARKNAEHRANAAYHRGSSAGYSSGSNDGRVAGLHEGSDSLTCSDDVDVTWLPYCRY